jgi:hypothetical protein
MQERNRISTAVSAASACLPNHLCDLTADYACRRPYAWNNVNAGNNASSTTNVDDPTETIFSCNGQDGWSKFVSEVTVVDGQINWTIDIVFQAGGGRVAVGLTSSIGNAVRGSAGIDEIADATTWLLYARMVVGYGMDMAIINIDAINNRHQLKVLSSPQFEISVPSAAKAGTYGNDFPEIRLCLSFTVDPATGTIGVGWRRNELTIRKEPVVVKRHTGWFGRQRPNFAGLRPFVAIQGIVEAVFRSGAGHTSDGSAVFLKTTG